MKTLWFVSFLLAVLSNAVQAQSASIFEKAKTAGVVVMGVRDSAGALSYTTGNGGYAGFHVELCQRIIAELQRRAGRIIEVRYQQVTAQNRIPLLQNGTIDIECGATTNNVTRQKDVAFLNTTFVEEVRMAVRASSGLASIAQLANRTLVTTTGTTGVQHLRKHERALGVDFKELYGKDSSESFLLLEADRAAAFVTDSQILAGHIANSKNPSLYLIAGEVLNMEPIAIMVRKDDVEFRKLGNLVIDQQIRSGALHALWAKWFVEPIPPNNVSLKLPLSEGTKAAWANPNAKPAEDYARK